MDKIITDPEIIKLINALQFYADPDTYFAIGFFPDPPCGAFINDFDDFMKPGAKARKILEALNIPFEYEEFIDEPKEQAGAIGYTGIQGTQCNINAVTQLTTTIPSCNSCRWFDDPGIKPCGDCESFIYYEPIQ
jgi:hypothetical protein